MGFFKEERRGQVCNWQDNTVAAAKHVIGLILPCRKSLQTKKEVKILGKTGKDVHIRIFRQHCWIHQSEST